MNKGGLELEVAGHRAFMPASQVSLERVADLNIYVGEKMTCQVTRVDRMGRGNIVLSRRDILEVQRKEQAAKLRESLQEGQTVEGVIRKIMPFGVFVDLGGVDGLVHVTDLTHDRVAFGEKAIAKYAKEGEKVRVQILKIDWEAKPPSLGITDPGRPLRHRRQRDQGTLPRLPGPHHQAPWSFGRSWSWPRVEGLVHISELAWRRVGKGSKRVPKQGRDRPALSILKVDPSHVGISLGQGPLSPPEPERLRPLLTAAAAATSAARAANATAATATPAPPSRSSRSLPELRRAGMGEVRIVEV